MQQKKHVVDIVFILVLLCVFAVVSFLLVGFGGQLYRSIVSKSDETYQTRTALSYITNKIHYAGGQADLVSVAGSTVLEIPEAVDGTEYATYIYFADGFLQEIFTQKNDSPVLLGGTQIVALSSVDFTEQQQAVRVSVRAQNGKEEWTVVGMQEAQS